MFGFLKRFKKKTGDTDAASPREDAPHGEPPEISQERPEQTPALDTSGADDSTETTSPPKTPPIHVPPEIEKPVSPAQAPRPKTEGADTKTQASDAISAAQTTVTGAETRPVQVPPADAKPAVTTPSVSPNVPAAPTEAEAEKSGLFSRLRNRLAKTRQSFTEGLADLVLGKKTIDDELLEELETRLLMADVGTAATRAMIDNLTRRVSRQELTDPEALFEALHALMVERLRQVEQPLAINPAIKPYVVLMTGINGAGKTTTIGKLAHRFQQQGRSVMLAAGDTFRAAAVEQLRIWGERNNVAVIGQPDQRDAGAVMFDAVQAAKARGIDVLIADTAGRLHTQGSLMEELKKLTRVIRKVEPSAPHEVLLVLDASIGQNALNQARQFHQAVGVSGLVITKLDGTAKGGIVFAIAEELGLPIRFIGLGETVEDLRPFDAEAYVDAMLDKERDNA